MRHESSIGVDPGASPSDPTQERAALPGRKTRIQSIMVQADRHTALATTSAKVEAFKGTITWRGPTSARFELSREPFFGVDPL